MNWGRQCQFRPEGWAEVRGLGYFAGSIHLWFPPELTGLRRGNSSMSGTRSQVSGGEREVSPAD